MGGFGSTAAADIIELFNIISLKRFKQCTAYK